MSDTEERLVLCMPVEWRDPEIERVAEAMGLSSTDSECADCGCGIIVSTKGAQMHNGVITSVFDLGEDNMVYLCGNCMSDRAFAAGDLDRAVGYRFLMTTMEEKRRGREEV